MDIRLAMGVGMIMFILSLLAIGNIAEDPEENVNGIAFSAFVLAVGSALIVWAL